MRTLAAIGLVIALGAVVAGRAGTASAEVPPHGAESLRVVVRVWQNQANARDIRVGIAGADSPQTPAMVPLALDNGVTAAGYRYGDAVLQAPLLDWAPPLAVEVRVWQGPHLKALFVSARPTGGSWLTLGTVRLPLDDGVPADGFRHGDIAIDIPLPAARVTTLAGQPGMRGYADGQGSEALFGRFAEDVGGLGPAVDRDGSVVVADAANRAIRRIAPDGTVTTIAGANGRGVRDGPGGVARFAGPSDVAIAPDGSIYVADRDGHRIRKITPDGLVTTAAGGGPIYAHPYGEGAWGTHADGQGTDARFSFPRGIALDGDGDLYIIEGHGRIRLLSSSGEVSTVAGASGPGRRDGPAWQAQFFYLLAIDIDSHGTIYVIDDKPDEGVSVRALGANRVVETIRRYVPASRAGALAAPHGLAAADDGVLYIANTGRHQVVALTPEGSLRAVAGVDAPGYGNGALEHAAFDTPGALALAADGSLFVADEGNNVIRRIVRGDGGLGPPGLVAVRERVAKSAVETEVKLFAGRPGPKFFRARRFIDGPAYAALFYEPRGMALDRDGNVIVADSGNHAIRRVAPDGTVTTIAGGNGEGARDGPCAEARFARPAGLAVSDDGAIFVADSRGNRIRRISPQCVVTTVAGGTHPIPSEGERNLGGYEDGASAEARFREPVDVVFDRDGGLLIAEHGNSRIRLLSPDGYVSTVGGAASLPRGGRYQGNSGSSDSYAHNALFFAPNGIAIDGDGNVFFTESNNAIRMIDERGFVSTVLRTPQSRYGGALSEFLRGIAVGVDGALYVADLHYGRVVRVTRDGVLSVVVDGLAGPQGILALPDGGLLVSDARDNAIWKITFEEAP